MHHPNVITHDVLKWIIMTLFHGDALKYIIMTLFYGDALKYIIMTLFHDNAQRIHHREIIP